MSKVVICAPRISVGARDLRDHINNNSDVDAVYRRRDNRPSLRLQLPPRGSLIVNWGCGGNSLDPRRDFNVSAGAVVPRLNERTDQATNKLTALRRLSEAGITVPEFTNNISTARAWVLEDHRVYCRTSLRGHSGEDIVIADQENPPVQAPLYTKEVVKRHEFRFHVAGGRVIDGVRKAFRADVPREDRDRTIMNHAAGTVFIRSGRSLTEAQQNQQLHQMCIDAVSALGLNFGAVDVMSDRDGNFYILEINTAPGLEATTLERYSNAFQAIVNNQLVQPWDELPLNPNPTQTETQTQETDTMPLLTQELLNSAHNRNALTAGNYDILVNDSFSGSTLSMGNSYRILSISRSDSANAYMISLRNDRGTIQRYTVRDQFSMGTSLLNRLNTQPEPELPSVNTSRSLPTTSPLRCVELSDGTMINVGGTVTYSGTGSSLLTTGNLYQVADIRYGESSGDCFIGLAVGDGGSIRRWLLSNFSQGQRVSAEGTSGTTAPAETSPVTDQSGTNLTIGDQVRVITRNGGHGLTVGSYHTIQTINSTTNNITVTGHSRPIAGRRVVKVTEQEQRQQTELQQEANQTQQLTFNGNQYNIRSRDITRVRNFLQSITV